MKRSVSLCLVFLLAIAFWSYGPASQEAEALTLMQLQSPADSTKVTVDTPSFEWRVTAPATEIPTRFQIQLATDRNFGTIIWDDTTIAGEARSKVYDGVIPLVEWTAYYWRMRVQVDSVRVLQGDTINYWQEDYSLVSTFFYATATLINVPISVPTIQQGIYWAAAGDTVLVENGTYYENLRFHKKNILLASSYLLEPDTANINATIIDGSKLTRGEKKGSVVYFSSNVDSSSTLMGFTLRGGTGTELDIGAEKRTSGGGIICDVGSSPTIKYNVITGNQAKHDGGGIFINSAAPNILYNMIIGNSTVEGSGGGIECRFSIPVRAAPGHKQDGGKGEEGLSAPETSRLEMTEEEIDNSLNPRDATEVYPVNAPPVLAKTTQNTPPVAVIDWHAVKDGVIIERDKYLSGDTLVFDGTGSYDPDGGDDYITQWQWRYFRHYRCYRDPSASPINFSSDSIAYLPIAEGDQLGIIRVYLEVQDTVGYTDRAYSQDTIEINVQYPPHVDAGEDVAGSPGDTIWLDGSASCDINPGDVLEYTWTQLSGLSVTIHDADQNLAFFVPPDSTYVGLYQFQLKVSDGMAADSVSIEGKVSRPPVPVCEDDPVWGDTLVGFGVQGFKTLDACASFDPDSGDSVVGYIWEEAGRWFLTKTGWQSISFSVSTNESQCSQTFSYPFPGLLKFRLRVRDTYQVESTVYDSVLYSVQYPPLADAGKDTVVRTGTFARLNGKAIETNPDQRDGIKYNWRVTQTPTPLTITPSDTVKSISFVAGKPGVYRLELVTDDRFALSPPDTIVVKANTPPNANVINVAHAFEGDTVLLDASTSADPDSETWGRELRFAWSLKSKPANAEVPVIVNSTERVAKFVPYGTGSYQFKVVVHDTLSARQSLDSVTSTGNVAFLTVNVDSTYAYPIIKGNLISSNYSGSRGGGVDCSESSPNIHDNVFYKNQSKLSGGGLCARNYSTPQIKNNIFLENVAGDSSGGGIADLKGQLAPSATRGFRRYAAIKNNDFWNNGGGAMYQTSGDISDNIYDFPRLVDPEFGDFTLECSSPCETKGIGKLVFFQPCGNVDQLQMVSLSMFQNPVASAAAHFVINTDAPLKTEPVAYVRIGNDAPAPVYFTPVSPKCFRGSFIFTSGGDAEISILASSVLEVDTTVKETFSVLLIGTGKAGTLASVDRMAKLSFPAGAVDKDIYVTCISVAKNSDYDFAGYPNLEAFGEPYQLGPAISFNEDLTVSFPLDDLDLGDRARTLFSIFKYDDGKWSALDSYLDGNSVCADVRNLGVYRLVYDPAGKHITGRPTTFALYQNCPNPFNPETQIRYDLPVSGHVNLTVYNVLGQKVRALVNEFQDVGRKSVVWDGHDDGGGEVASGIYFYKIKVENFEKTRKMVLIK